MGEYVTTHQYEPLRAPSGWSAEERRLIAQLTDILDDVYRRFGRLRIEDMGRAFRARLESDEGAISTVEQTAEGLSARVEGMDGDVAAVKLTTQGLSAAVSNNRVAFSAAGLTVKNAQGTTVFSQDNATGNLTVTGSIAASGGTIGGFNINADGLSYGSDFIIQNGRSGFTPRIFMGGLLASGGSARSLRFDDNDVIYLSIGEGAVALQGAVTVNGVSVPKIVRGTAWVSGSSAATLNYGAAGFAQTPVVVASFSSASGNVTGDWGSIKIYSKGLGAATMILGGSDTALREVDWIAVGV